MVLEIGLHWILFIGLAWSLYSDNCAVLWRAGCGTFVTERPIKKGDGFKFRLPRLPHSPDGSRRRNGSSLDLYNFRKNILSPYWSIWLEIPRFPYGLLSRTLIFTSPPNFLSRRSLNLVFETKSEAGYCSVSNFYLFVIRPNILILMLFPTTSNRQLHIME